MDPAPAPPYPDLLEAARVLGCADGWSAAGSGPSAPPGADHPSCGGLDPEDLARLLWGNRPGDPPAGLELNAPLWYDAGFAEALNAARSRADRRRSPGSAPVAPRTRG
jgi:hypothetical protein